MNANATQQIFSRVSDEWETPQDLFDWWNGIYQFDLDACATYQNAKCPIFFSKEKDGLSQQWGGDVWCNPPYSQVASWVHKAYEEKQNGNVDHVVMLLPARTDTKWFHDYIYPHKADIVFLKGRLKFSGAKNNAPFPSMIVIF